MSLQLPPGAVLCFTTDAVRQAELERRLRIAGFEVGATEDDEAWRQALRQLRPAVAVLEVVSDDSRSLARVRASRQSSPGVALIVCSAAPDADTLLTLLRLGVADVVPGSEGPAGVVAAVERVALRQAGGEGNAPQGERVQAQAGGFSVTAPPTTGGFTVSAPPPTTGFPVSPPPTTRPLSPDPQPRWVDTVRSGDSGARRAGAGEGGAGSPPLTGQAQSVLSQLAGRHAQVALPKGAPERPNPGGVASRAATTSLPGRIGVATIGSTPDDMPQLDSKIGELQELMGRPDCPIEDIERFVVRDPALVMAVLKVANSAYFRSPRLVTSIREACVRMGNRQVFALLLENILRRSFSSTSLTARPIFEEMWRNAALTARVARRLAEWQRFGRPEDVYVAALLHNLGEFVMVWRIVAEGDHDLLGRLAANADRIAREHEAVGQAAAQKWGLPPQVQVLAGFHHRPRVGEPASDTVLRGSIVACWALARSVSGEYLPMMAPADPIALFDEIALSEALRARIAEECLAALEGL